MTYIIAEVGGNHDGNIEQAMRLIVAAKNCGADAVKFQIVNPSMLVHSTLPALKQAKGHEYQIDRFNELAFTGLKWRRIIQMCKHVNIDFLASCFDLESLTYYESDMNHIKIASGDLTYDAIIKKAATFNKPVFLSTGMANIEEVEHAVNLIPVNIPVTVMHCVTSYPCDDENANLGMIDYYNNYYSRVGYSDHTVGITACIAAAALGVGVIEKHFTLDNTLNYGDHPLSATPQEFAELVQHVRRLQVMCEWNGTSAIEQVNASHFRRGVYSARDIKKGCVINLDDIAVLRPATHTKPDDIIGTIAPRDYKQGDSFDGRKTTINR